MRCVNRVNQHVAGSEVVVTISFYNLDTGKGVKPRVEWLTILITGAS